MAKAKININTADVDELKHLRMMGDVRAKYLMENRPFHDWDEVRNKVPSISDQMIDDMKKSGAILE